MTNTMGVITHPIVVTTDGECIALIMAALHDQEVKEEEESNAYEMSPNKAGWGQCW